MPETKKRKPKAAKKTDAGPLEIAGGDQGKKTLAFERAAAILAERDGKPSGVIAQWKAIHKSACESDADAWLEAHRAETLWARELLNGDPHFAILADTETTRTGADAEIIDVGGVFLDGSIAFDSLVKPELPIAAKASAIHGISQADVESARSFAEILPVIQEACDEAQLFIAYNGEFDQRVIEQSAYYAGRDVKLPPSLDPDVMVRFAKWVGDWDPRWQHYKWHRLESGHRAMGDAQAILRLLKAMASSKAPEMPHPLG